MAMGLEAAKAFVSKFNEMYHLGDSVWLIDDIGNQTKTSIKYAAEVAQSGIPVIWVHAKSGCYDLGRIIPIPKIQEKENALASSTISLPPDFFGTSGAVGIG